MKLEVMDHTGFHDITVFGDVGENLLGCTAKQLEDMKIQVRKI
jgi:hypothetical protein